MPADTADSVIAPFAAEMTYPMNAVDTLRNLARNYISKESLQNFLAALVTANVLASYTMTWDADENQYKFTLTKA